MSLLVTELESSRIGSIYRGEVRDVYEFGNKFISVATDRMSVFGHLFPDPIPYKGQVLNQLTAYFANATKDIVDNWVEEVPHPRVTVGKKCESFKVNMVIRGALIGHVFRIYEAGMRSICDVNLPEGLDEFDLFEEPIITPSTKAPNGYEEDISGADIVDQGLMTEEQFERLSILTRQLFIKGKQLASERGLILADTKYEFGLLDGKIILIDEIHTPDSSRYYDQDEYHEYLNNRSDKKPANLSKEFIRQYLLESGYSGLDDQIIPEIKPEVIDEISELYIKIFERLTGEQFQKMNSGEDEAKQLQEILNKYIDS